MLPVLIYGIWRMLGSRFQNRSETKIPPNPSDLFGIYASVLFLHLEHITYCNKHERNIKTINFGVILVFRQYRTTYDQAWTRDLSTYTIYKLLSDNTIKCPSVYIKTIASP